MSRTAHRDAKSREVLGLSGGSKAKTWVLEEAAKAKEALFCAARDIMQTPDGTVLQGPYRYKHKDFFRLPLTPCQGIPDYPTIHVSKLSKEKRLTLHSPTNHNIFTAKMQYKNILVIVGLAALSTVVAQEFDNNDVPSVCRSLCDTWVTAARTCDEQLDNDRQEVDCICNTPGADTSLAECAACVRTYASDDDDDEDGIFTNGTHVMNNDM
jgi:hypothetical protein